MSDRKNPYAESVEKSELMALADSLLQRLNAMEDIEPLDLPIPYTLTEGVQS